VIYAEDSVIINKAALDRGMFTTTAFKTTKEEERKNQTELQTETFRRPDANTVTDPSKANFDAIGDDGMPIRGKRVKQGDVLIGKSIKLNPGKDGVAKYSDVSHKVELGGAGVVDDVRVAINGDGFKFCKVRVRSTRVPEIGDKVQSRHAQKGCVFFGWTCMRLN
jgi:DNA-directed RNA polymerase II subunit RPB2